MEIAYKNCDPPEELNPDEFEYLFAQCDEDNNEFIDRKEFVPFIRSFGKIERFKPGYEFDSEEEIEQARAEREERRRKGLPEPEEENKEEEKKEEEKKE